MPRHRTPSNNRKPRLWTPAMQRFAVAAIILSLSFGWSSTAWGQAPPGKIPVAVTISGGGTRGAYMAGQLFYLDHVRRLSGERLDLRVFTGASAGSINSVVGALSACTSTSLNPTESLYYNTWIPTGLNEAFDPKLTTAVGVLTRDAFKPAFDRLHELWLRGLPKSCDVIVGVAVTRMRPHRVALTEGFPSLPRSLETILVRITGQGPGVQPRLRNYVDPSLPTPQLLLPLDGKGATPFESLAELVFASSAFPIGFAPVHLEHCMSTPGKPAKCTKAMARRLWFMDGGVFDNQPLGLAVRAMRGITVDGGEVKIADAPGPNLNPAGRFVYVDPRVSDLPDAPSEEEAAVDSALGVITGLMSTVESARSAELIRVFERFPQLQNRLLLPRAHLLPVSSTFSGFLERSFREFDFALGMYDAARSVRLGTWGSIGLPAKATPEKVLMAKANRATREAWRPFRCLQHLIDEVGDDKSCAGESMRDFRILAQLTFDRVYDHCQRVAEAEGTTADAKGHVICRRAMNGWLARRVPGVRDQPDAERRRKAGESDIMYLLRLLGYYRFHFKDLGLAREDADQAPFRVIRLAQRMSHALAQAQPALSLPLGVLGRLGVDAGLGYVPSEHILHLSVGLGLEFGYSMTFDHPQWDWLRLSMALELGGLSSLFSAQDNYLTVIPKVGPEIELYGSSAVQLRVGFRAGFQFSTADSWRGDPCNHLLEDEVPCSRFTTETYVSSSLLGLVRVHVAGVWLPAIEDGQPNQFAVRPMIGLQLNSPF